MLVSMCEQENEAFFPPARNVKWCSNSGSQCTDYEKELYLPRDSAISLLGIDPKYSTSYSTAQFIATLLRLARK